MSATENQRVEWPKKTSEYFHNHIDSTLWNDFPFRDDDIIIGTYVKSGTTWVQQIVGQLIFNGETGVDVAGLSLWIDFRIPPPDVKFPAVEAQTHRRFLKTHLHVDALVYSPKAKYIYIARDGRDVVWSYYNHHEKHSDFLYEALNAAGDPGIEPFAPPRHEIREYFLYWLENDGYPIWPFWKNIRSWWEIRDLPNLMLLHFSDLKADLPGRIREIASFLDIPIDETKWEAIVEHCSFDYMREHAEESVPLGGKPWKGGARSFIYKGTNGRWRDTLTDDDVAKYETLALKELGPECAHWLATGEIPE